MSPPADLGTLRLEVLAVLSDGRVTTKRLAKIGAMWRWYERFRELGADRVQLQARSGDGGRQLLREWIKPGSAADRAIEREQASRRDQTNYALPLGNIRNSSTLSSSEGD